MRTSTWWLWFLWTSENAVDATDERGPSAGIVQPSENALTAGRPHNQTYPLRELSGRHSVAAKGLSCEGLMTDPVEDVVAPAAIERALSVYQRLNPCEQSVLLQARKIVTQHIFGMVDKGERDEQRLTVGGLARLKSIERDHAIRSASASISEARKSKCASKPQPNR